MNEKSPKHIDLINKMTEENKIRNKTTEGNENECKKMSKMW